MTGQNHNVPTGFEPFGANPTSPDQLQDPALFARATSPAIERSAAGDVSQRNANKTLAAAKARAALKLHWQSSYAVNSSL